MQCSKWSNTVLRAVWFCMWGLRKLPLLTLQWGNFRLMLRSIHRSTTTSPITNTFTYKQPFLIWFHLSGEMLFLSREAKEIYSLRSVLLQLAPNVHLQHQVHAMRALTCYSWKAFILKHENNSARINKVVFMIVINNRCRMYQRLQRM